MGVTSGVGVASGVTASATISAAGDSSELSSCTTVGSGVGVGVSVIICVGSSTDESARVAIVLSAGTSGSAFLLPQPPRINVADNTIISITAHIRFLFIFFPAFFMISRIPPCKVMFAATGSIIACDEASYNLPQ